MLRTDKDMVSSTCGVVLRGPGAAVRSDRCAAGAGMKV